jgi:hydroxymethylpyrimidine pyrophosphatase-like HAD family hydrolase
MNEINTKYKKYVNTYLVANKYKSVEIIPSTTDKSEAINIILDIEKIKDENVYTIGDASNDKEMISKYNGYGMANSEDCIIKIAKRLYNNVHDLIKDIL